MSFVLKSLSLSRVSPFARVLIVHYWLMLLCFDDNVLAFPSFDVILLRLEGAGIGVGQRGAVSTVRTL